MMFADMDMTVSRPNGTKLNAIVEVSLGRVLRAVVVFKGMVIEWVVIRGWTEESSRDDGQVDVWTESKYEVFRRCTLHASAAMLNFQVLISNWKVIGNEKICDASSPSSFFPFKWRTEQ